jgi:hypothetical protein
MEILETALALFLGLSIGFTIGYCRKIYLNRGFTKRNKINGSIEAEQPYFYIVSAEKAISPNNYGKEISKYKARIWFKRGNNVCYEEVIFFDEIGKYNVGDILTLTK